MARCSAWARLKNMMAWLDQVLDRARLENDLIFLPRGSARETFRSAWAEI